MYYRNKEDLAWCAGIFEGEGTISTRMTLPKSNSRRKQRDRSIIIKIKMTDLDVLQKFNLIIGFGNLTGPYFLEGRKPYYIWQTGKFEYVQATCAMLWRWLCSRRQAKIIDILTLYKESPRKHGPDGPRGKDGKYTNWS